MDTPQKRPPDHLSVDRPSAWVRRFAPLIPKGEVLDLACGAGRHSRLLAELGYQVLAADRSADSLALAAGSNIATLQVDLETGSEQNDWPFAAGRFAGVVVTNYLHRPLFGLMIDSLETGGVLIYETFARGNEQFGKPSNPDFLLASGELLEFALRHSMRVIAYEEGYIPEPKPAMVQRICLIKSGAHISSENLRLA